MKRVIYLISALLLTVLLVSCGQNTPKFVDKEFKGNPDLNNLGPYGLMYSLDSDVHSIDEVIFDSYNKGGRICIEDFSFSLKCIVSEEANDIYNWRKNYLSSKKTVENTMELCIIKNDKQYQWNEEDILYKSKAEYRVDRIAGGENMYYMNFHIQIPESMKQKPGKYTLVFYNPDGKIDSMLDFKTFSSKDVDPKEFVYKPVIYLYPEEEKDINVTLDFDGEFTCTYPQYDNGWNITAQPDGTLYEADSDRYYNYLFWEGTTDIPDSFDKAIVVSGDETASFLEEYLEAAGLNDSEMDDFITFWLPKMQNNPYNLISFPTEEYEEIAKLNVDPMPDTVIRVYMVYKPLDEYIEIPEEQQLQMPQGVERNGFTVVEWGGSVAE